MHSNVHTQHIIFLFICTLQIRITTEVIEDPKKDLIDFQENSGVEALVATGAWPGRDLLVAKCHRSHSSHSIEKNPKVDWSQRRHRWY